MDGGRAETVHLLRRLHAEWRDGKPSDWDNATVPQYLGGLAEWIADCDGYYANQGRPTPTDPWQIVQDAVQAARVYE